MKISIMGYSGSGKSTLAQFLGKQYGIPVLHLDTVNFSSGWQERDRAQAVKLVQDFMNQNNSWVIDGNYSAFLQQERLCQSEQIIFMAFNRFNCLWRAFQRYRQYQGRTRESMAPGCNEKLDREFVAWILLEGRKKSRWQGYKKALQPHMQKVIIIKNQRQLEGYMAGNRGKLPQRQKGLEKP